jgi:hypothetical protein
MKYSIKIKELIDRPIIRNDQMYEWMNKMTDNETEDYFGEIDLILDEEGIPRNFPDWNAAHLAKMIDRDILYRLFKDVSLMQSGKEINRKTLWLGLTRVDLQKHKEDLPFDNVGVFDFRSSSLSRKELDESDVIVFTDNDGKMKYLKDRYVSLPLNK